MAVGDKKEPELVSLHQAAVDRAVKILCERHRDRAESYQSQVVYDPTVTVRGIYSDPYSLGHSPFRQLALSRADVLIEAGIGAANGPAVLKRMERSSFCRQTGYEFT